MSNMRTVVIAALLASIAGASFATAAQAENRQGKMPSRTMIKKHTMKHRSMTSHHM